MNAFHEKLPESTEALRARLYEGACYLRPPNEPSLEVVEDVRALMATHLGQGDPREAETRYESGPFFERIGRVRKALYEDDRFHEHVFRIVEAQGFSREEVAFDPLRLRVVSHLGHENPRAAPIYYPHRDTWFGLSQSVIAWSVQVFDVPEEETFLIYPEWLARPIPNTSVEFDYGWWRKDDRELKVGWQDRNAGRDVHYSGATGNFEPGTTLSFSGHAGTNVFFSGAHLHQTRAHAAGHTRYSLDFRMVHKADHAAGRGPKNVDDESTGDATVDYVGADRVDQP